MEAEDILTATHKLEESGMTRSQSEAIANTIIAAVAPLATKADLESMREQMATKADLESMKEQMVTKTDIEAINTSFENVNTRIESMKHWLSSGLLAIALSILVLAFTLNP